MERVWRDLNDDRAWQLVTTLELQQDYVGGLLRAYDTSTLQSVTAYAYFVEAVNALCA